MPRPFPLASLAPPAILALAVALAPILTAPAIAKAEHAERKKGGGLSYTQFPALTASVFRSDGRRGVLSVEAGVDCPDPAVKTRTDLLGPRLRDAYVQYLAAYAAGLAPGALPDADQIAAALQRKTDVVVGRPGARLLLGDDPGELRAQEEPTVCVPPPALSSHDADPCAAAHGRRARARQGTLRSSPLTRPPRGGRPVGVGTQGVR